MKSKKILATIFVSFLLSLAIFNRANAQTASPTPEPTQSPEVDPDLVKENIKKRIEQVVEDKKETIDEILEEKSIVKRAWIGTLESIANFTITIQSQNESRLASISAQTTIVQAPKNTDLDLDELVLGDYLMVMGYINGNEVMEAKRIVASSETPVPELDHQSFHGKLSDIDQDEETFTITNQHEEKLVLSIDKDSEIFDQNDEEVNFEDLVENQTITTIYTKANKDDPATLTKAVVIIPQESENQEATSSAETNNSPEPDPPELGN